MRSNSAASDFGSEMSTRSPELREARMQSLLAEGLDHARSDQARSSDDEYLAHKAPLCDFAPNVWSEFMARS